jgi:hypothetical protein
MEERLAQILKVADYRQSLAIKRKALKEKIEGKLTFGHAGGIFKIDQSLILFTQFLIDQERTTNVVLLDHNDNPILITDLVKFKEEIMERYFTSLFEYYEQYETIKKSRTIEKLLEL